MARKRTIDEEQKRLISNQRAAELKAHITDFLEAKPKILTGIKLQKEISTQKNKILQILDASEEDWENWRWQIAHRISDVETLSKIINLTLDEKRDLEELSKKFRWAISPYYASLMDPDDPKDPIRLQAVPSVLEYSTEGLDDPMGEEYTSPVPGITRRYPDRLIINVTNQCPMFCRHCQRRRNFGELDRHTPKNILDEALQYIRNNPEIRDVLVTGGDALTLSNKVLDWLLGELDKIEHVEIKRLGTRTLVTMPQRITPELCAILEKHHPLYINTHFNHPKEITPEAARACDMLTRAGIPLGNQAVLLKGINNDPNVMKVLNQELLKIRVRPYYIFHAKEVKGTTHFVCSIDEGIEIMEKLRGYTSGLAIPTYIINAPGGLGKTPILPEYLIEYDDEKIILNTWEGKKIHYHNRS